MRILAVDVGNTNIGFGIFYIVRRVGESVKEGRPPGRIIKKFSIPTERYNKRKLEYYLGMSTIDNIIICSVVPRLSRILKIDLKKLLNRKPYLLGYDIKVPIRNLYLRPEQVGQDRLANAYGAATIYGFPAIVVDFGTAITLDIISKNKEYLGGLILPGMRISLDALFRKTALLSHIQLVRPKVLVGRDTKCSILSGVVHGAAFSVDALINQIKMNLGYPRLKVIGTGGDINLISPFLRQIKIRDRELTLRAIALLAQEKFNIQ